MPRPSLALALVVCLAGCRSPSSSPASVTTMGRSWTILGGDWSATADSVTGTGGWLMSVDTFGDATVDLDVEHLSGQGGRTVGIGFRYQPWTDAAKTSGYGVNLTTGGTTFNVFHGTGGVWLPVNPAWKVFQPSPAIHAAKNHIQIRSQGSSHTIFVNGQQVSTFEDAAYPRGALNLWVESTVDKVKFSGLRITQ